MADGFDGRPPPPTPPDDRGCWRCCLRCCLCLVAIPALLALWEAWPKRITSAVSPDGRYVARVSAPRTLGGFLGGPIRVSVADRQTRRVTTPSSIPGSGRELFDTVRVVWAPDGRSFATYWAVEWDDPDDLGKTDYDYTEWVLSRAGLWQAAEPPHRRGDVLVAALADPDPGRRRKALADVGGMCLAGRLSFPEYDGLREGLAIGHRVTDSVDAGAWLGTAVDSPCAHLSVTDETPRAADPDTGGDPWSASAPVALAWNARFLLVRTVLECYWPYSDQGFARFPAELRVCAGPPAADHATVGVLVVAASDGSSSARMCIVGSPWGRVRDGVRWAVYREPYAGFSGARELFSGAKWEGAILCLAIPWSVLGVPSGPSEGDLLPFALTAEAEIDDRGATYAWFGDLRKPVADNELGRVALLGLPGETPE